MGLKLLPCSQAPNTPPVATNGPASSGFITLAALQSQSDVVSKGSVESSPTIGSFWISKAVMAAGQAPHRFLLVAPV